MKTLMLALALILAAPSKGPTPAPAKTAKEQQDQTAKVHGEPAANQQTTNPAPPALAKPGAVVTTRNQSYRGSVKKSHPSSDGWGIVGTIAGVANTALLTFFSGALAWLAYRQWRAMKRQATLMHAQARLMLKQLGEMKTTSADMSKLATAAKLSADTAKRALETVERPDVLVVAITPDDDTVSDVDQYPGWIIGPETVFEVTVKNYGRTTARELEIHGFLAIEPMPGHEMPLRAVETPEVLGAGEVFKFKFLPLANFLDRDCTEQIMRGTVTLWVQANIEYVGFERHRISGHGTYDASLGEFSITHGDAERPLS